MGRALKRVAKSFTVRVSPQLAAEEAREKGIAYDLSPDEKEALLSKLLKYDFAEVIQNGIIKQFTHFNPLASTYFPYMSSVPAGGNRTPDEVLKDFPLLKKAMDKNRKLHLLDNKRSKAEIAEEEENGWWLRDYLPESRLTKASIRKAVSNYTGTQNVSQFSPVQAGGIYHKYLPEKGGVTWDMSCGWGGRLAGAIACRNVHKYIGCDPSTQTFKGLEQMRDELLPMAQSAGRNLEVKLYMLGSETKKMRAALPKGGVDLCFTSPPYGWQELYADEATQAAIKYPDPDSWLNGFMAQTLDNCWYALKPGGVMAINIANVSTYKTLEDDFVTLAKRKGFTYVQTLTLLLSARPGTKQKHKSGHKHEPVFVFSR
jgi:hypothetical protein